ncbi:hypothetical protein [Marinigracilibium pacificum]|uniref:TraB family protein n=1 Tax=Marinigracilibium pacificum TaxID=2729599 RepID=A0A848IT98_9BACT|nr:hypothetical protein [Marinigracilibium pacificum]NMM47693.1 hypothetical protein [Marinigracilibium pacificum]
MKKLILVILSSIALLSCQDQKPTEIIVIGTLHNPEPNFNPDILMGILEDLEPDFILREQDSASFTPDFRQKEVPENSNESMASYMYVNKYPSTQLRPFEFEGRNEYRKNIGSRPTDHLTTKLIDSLNNANLLTDAEAKIHNKYQDLLMPLIEFAAKEPKYFNNPKTDSICEQRQYYQYQMLQKITNNREEFANHFHTKPDGEKISYREGYKLAADFWDLRNQTMARNIMKITELNEGKKIVVLVGFMHRYYLIKELKQLIQGKDIVLKEFYE